MTEIKIPKKLIEVALPLDDINLAAGKEKSIRQGHPSTLHLWWARRPLAAARAILFAQLVNDPGYQREIGFGVNKHEAEKKREELFDIIRDLVKWENTNNREVLEKARKKIKESWEETCYLNRNHPEASTLFNPDNQPPSHDPFAGGGAIPLEAQKLGLKSLASDLNPIAVMINKAMIELPVQFYGQKPIGPEKHDSKPTLDTEDWTGSSGIAEDVNRYGSWFRERLIENLSVNYPEVAITEDLVKQYPYLEAYEGEQLKVVSWIWSRTVASPSPALSGVHVPLLKSFQLSEKKGKEFSLQPVLDGASWSFKVQPRKSSLKGTVGRGGATCLVSETPIPLSYIREQAKAGNLKERLVAIVCDGPKGRIYLPAIEEHALASNVTAERVNDISIDHWAGCTNCVVYGFDTFGKLFTDRQYHSMSVATDLLSCLNDKVKSDGGSDEYAKAITTYIAFALDKMADYSSSFCGWIAKGETIRNTYGRQAIPMVWDYAESNPLSTSTGSFYSGLNQVYKCLLNLSAFDDVDSGIVMQLDAASQTLSQGAVVSSDPPYFDNVPYSNISDFFYLWLRKGLKPYYPDLFGTISVPKMPEIVANQFRHGGKSNAETFFLEGMRNAITRMRENSHPAFPVSLYYAFKQSETTGDGTTSTGWETFLDSIVESGFSITGTWPVRTERSSRTMSIGMNALASSVVLICSPRDVDAEVISRRQLQRELKHDMPEALEAMVGGVSGQSPIAPVDLAQAAIGPGMAIYSKYKSVINQDGSEMKSKDALLLINKAITDFLSLIQVLMTRTLYFVRIGLSNLVGVRENLVSLIH